MKFQLGIIFIMVFVFVAAFVFFPQSVRVQQSIQIDGVYRFISEKTVLKKPKATVINRTFPKWSGLFFFKDGYFNITIMDQTRNDDWFTNFPKNITEVGFESFSGKFEINNNTLILKPEIQLEPYYDSRRRTFEVKVDGNNLILDEKILSYPEDIREGETTITLSKLKADTK